MSVDVKVYELYDTNEINVRDVSFELPIGNDIAFGIDRLFQQIVKSLFTTPGSDKFNKSWGGGLQNILPIIIEGGTISSSSKDRIYFAVSKVNGDIIRNQVQYPVPAQYTLKNLRILSLDLLIDEQELSSEVVLSLEVSTSDSKIRTLRVTV